jgi:hypothetical protein
LATSAQPVRAGVVVQVLVYVDENTLTAFYLGTAEGRKAGDCKPDPFGTQSQCTLNFAKDNNGVPTVTYPPGTFNGGTTGDVLLTEEDSSELSDLFRFSKNSLQFYSDPGDPNDISSFPTPAPNAVTKCNSSPNKCQEMDLGLLTVALSNDSQHNLALGGFLKGKIGAFYSAMPTDPGGTSQASKGVGYVFVSDGETPEPGMAVPAGCAIAGWVLRRWRVRRRRNCGRTSSIQALPLGRSGRILGLLVRQS